MSLFEENEFSLFDNEIEEFVLVESFIEKRNENSLKANIEIHPGDARFPNEPYIKISRNANDWNDAEPKDRTRISIKYLAYVDHPSNPGKWRLKSSEREKLVEALKSPYPKDKNKTVWDAILYKAYNESNGRVKEDIMDLPLLDYNELKPTDKPNDRKVKYYGV